MKLRQIAKVVPGFHFRGTIKPHPKGAYRVIQVKDFGEFKRFDAGALTRVQPDRDVRPHLVRQGDVLFLSRGTRHFSVAIEEELENTLAPNHFLILRIQSAEILPAYLGWYLNSPGAQAALRMVSQGSHVPFITMRELEELEIPVPPLEVQKRIIAVTALAEREQRLAASLLEAREQLVTALCLDAAHRSA
jgi:hypothetical protein